MDDPSGDEFGIHPAKQFHNTWLDDSLNHYLREVVLSGNDSNVCLTITINNLGDSAYAPLLIADNQGGAQLIELQYYPLLGKLSPDSGKFLVLKLNKDSCMNIV